MIWTRGLCRIKETSNWAGPEVPNNYVLKDTLPPQNVPHTPLPQTQDEKSKKQTFCCYNCLDLYHTQSFFPVFVTYFPSSLEQEQCLEKVINSWPSASNLHNLFSKLFLLSRTWKTSNSHFGKTFLIANLDNYSNKILCLIYPKKRSKGHKQVHTFKT